MGLKRNAEDGENAEEDAEGEGCFLGALGVFERKMINYGFHGFHRF